ncbi:hypothetical protein SBV1_3700004 [Verrucomicrobia bacterium]|nr:hypothetical protein SBV1_3700004 [Verrucomicrobiota bacterium]
MVEPTATIFFFDRLCPDADVAAQGTGGHGVGNGAMRNHPAEVAEDRSTGPGDSTQNLDLACRRLSSRHIVCACARGAGDGPRDLEFTSLDRHAQQVWEPAGPARFDRSLKYFANPAGQAKHCLSAAKLILPACSEAFGWSAGLSA